VTIEISSVIFSRYRSIVTAAARPAPIYGWMQTQRVDHINVATALLRSGFMPFFALFLHKHGLGPTSIGKVMAFGSLASLLATIPGGVLVDHVRGRPVWPIVAGALALGAFLILFYAQGIRAFLCAVAMMSLSEAVLAPALLAMNFSIVPQEQRVDQLGRNQAFGHFGRVAGLALSGMVGSGFGFSTLIAFESLYLVILLALVWRAPPFVRAEATEIQTQLWSCGTLLWLSMALGLFQVGNAAVSLLLGLSLADHSRLSAPALSSSSAIVAQVAMIVGSVLVVPLLRRWGSWRVFAASFALLPLRCALAAMLPAPDALIPVELLHGFGEAAQMVAIGAAIGERRATLGGVGVRYGSLMLFQELGKTASPLLACYVAERWSLVTAYGLLGAIGLLSVSFWIFCRPHVAAPDGDGRLMLA
jgi:MFS family permease